MIDTPPPIPGVIFTLWILAWLFLRAVRDYRSTQLGIEQESAKHGVGSEHRHYRDRGGCTTWAD